MRKKRIGLIGGISHESTAAYYLKIHQKYFEKYHNYYYPEIVLFSLDFQKFTDFENVRDYTGYVEYIRTAQSALERAGVDFIAMTANSPHAVFSELEKSAQVPLLSIVQATAKEAKKRKVQSALLLGIRFTMQSSFYQDAFAAQGVSMITPTAREQDDINRIIFDELCVGNIQSESKQRYLDIIRAYPTDAVVLGCTEIPLLIGQGDTERVVLNPLEVHVDAIVTEACQD